MQHLDEGLIHSWLDGALNADEAARVKTHVEECPQCAAAVAEARGFIAASSRILTALDNVPKGVVPIGARAKPRNWGAWRAAAAVLVVALGSFAVLRERMDTRSSAAEIVPFNAPITAAGGDSALMDMVQQESLSAKQAPTTSKVLAKPATPTRVASPVGVAKMGNEEPPARDNSSMLAAAPSPSVIAPDVPAVAPGNAAVLQGGGAMKGSAEASSARVAGVVPSPRPSSRAMADAAAGPISIRAVSTSTAIGEQRTQYEVAPGDTVTLAEVAAVTFNSVVATGVGTTTARSVDTSGTRIQIRGATTRSTVPETQSGKASSGTQAATARAPSVQTLNGVTTLTWIDPVKGSMMRLSGRHTAAELLEIKRGIEQLRAAEAAKKKP